MNLNLITKILFVFKNPKVLIVKVIELQIRRIIIRKFQENPDNFYFVQIGSNDGITGDNLYNLVTKFGWRGVLVEPVPYIFKKLKENYKGNKGLIFENVAIAQKNGYKNFYRVKKNNNPANPIWYDHISSFEKEVVLKHKSRIPSFEKYFTREKIKTITLKRLLSRNKVKKIDLLNIDTEGYDFQIIKRIDFEKIKPKMVLYEHIHLSEKDKKACAKLLKKNGYKIIVNKFDLDTFAYL